MDVLTDGSEYTGNGTLFLSVYRSSWNSTTNTKTKHENHHHQQDDKTTTNNDDDDDTTWSRKEEQQQKQQQEKQQQQQFSSNIWNKNNDDNNKDINVNDNDDDDVNVVARYALAGVGDCTSRLVADQKYKLKTVRAVFCTSDDVQLVMGIASLLFALRDAGASSLALVTPNLSTVEPMIQWMMNQNHFTHPQVQLCEVPSSSSSTSSSTTLPTNSNTNNEQQDEMNQNALFPCWWQVYKDEYLYVHAVQCEQPPHARLSSSSSSSSSSSWQTVFLYTVVTPHTQSLPPFSFLVTPSMSLLTNKILENLPVIRNHDDDNNNNDDDAHEQHLTCSFVIITTTTTTTTTNQGNTTTTVQQQQQQPSFVQLPCTKLSLYCCPQYYWTQPCTNDVNLLVRARHQSMTWNHRLPQYFPWNPIIDSLENDEGEEEENNNNNNSKNNNMRYNDTTKRKVKETQLTTRSRLVWGQELMIQQTTHDGVKQQQQQDVLTFTWSIPKLQKPCPTKIYPRNYEKKKEDDDDIKIWKDTWQRFMKVQSISSIHPSLVVDDNEIEIDDQDDNNDDDDDEQGDCENETKSSGVGGGITISSNESTPPVVLANLLVLGTGCATPSPYRGASGYVLLLGGGQPGDDNESKPYSPAPSNQSNPINHESSCNTEPLSSSSSTSSSWAIVFEAGEGFVTQWHRHAPIGWRDSLYRISVIWISHAHWDHYGGLAPLLLAIASSWMEQQQTRRELVKQNKKIENDDDLFMVVPATAGAAASSSLPRTKRQRRQSHTNNTRFSIPTVYAPRKVLQFLTAMWPRDYDSYFHGVAHEENTTITTKQRALTWRQNWNHDQRALLDDNNDDDKNHNSHVPVVTFWENVRVDHSCRHSYGFVMGLASSYDKDNKLWPQEQEQFPTTTHVLAFSGDTRPCPRFVQACQRFCRSSSSGSSNGGIDFLIHEATFDQEDYEMSVQKKHSTIQEALNVSDQVQARRTLLTHFSQRYNNNNNHKNGHRRPLPCHDYNKKNMLFHETTMTTTTCNGKRSNNHHGLPRQVAMAVDGMLIPLYSSSS